jgi:hypothetical protein
MIYNLSKADEAAKAQEYLTRLIKQGKKITLAVRRKRRSYAQNAYLHLILGWYGIETGYTLAEVKQHIFKEEVCASIFQKAKHGRVVTRSTAELNTLEMTNAIEQFRNHAQADLNIYLPAPNEYELLESLEQQLQQYGNAQYL